jgi:hypothetical protein
MVQGDLDSAKVVTHTRVTVINDDGTVGVKRVMESLDIPQEITSEARQTEVPHMDYEMHNMDNMSPPPVNARPSRVRINYTGHINTKF